MAKPGADLALNNVFSECSDKDIVFLVKHMVTHMIGWSYCIDQQHCDTINSACQELMTRGLRRPRTVDER